MRITWYSNHPEAATGYGQQTAEVVPRIKAAGHDIAVLSNFGLMGHRETWNGVTIYPGGKTQYSVDIVNAHHDEFRGDWCVTLYDTWPLPRDAFPERVASWVPIDHQPVPEDVLRWCHTVRPVAMSRFGQRMLKEQGLESVYIPHSINIAKFSPGDRSAREAMQLPEDAYVVIVVAANWGHQPSRKAWPEMFWALGRFMQEHPDAYLYVHTDHTQRPGPNNTGGVDLHLIARHTGLPEDRIRWTDAYRYASGAITQDELIGYYRASDVMLATSMGEGFGIPVVEAQACGVPVIVSDFSSQPELAAEGWLVRGQPWWDGAQRSNFFTPYIADIYKRLEEAYAARGDNGPRERAIAKAAQFDSDLVFERHWKPLLVEMEASLSQPEPVSNRAERRRQERAARKANKRAAA